ncbi:unnamed protein product, partial [Discosporangium mesarthrocarpum]
EKGVCCGIALGCTPLELCRLPASAGQIHKEKEERKNALKKKKVRQLRALRVWGFCFFFLLARYVLEASRPGYRQGHTLWCSKLLEPEIVEVLTSGSRATRRGAPGTLECFRLLRGALNLR